jgi:hypothetical protein
MSDIIFDNEETYIPPLQWFVDFEDNIKAFNSEPDRYKYLVALAENHPDYIAYRANDKVHAKIMCVNEHFHINQIKKNIKIYNDIGHLNITPPLIEYKQLFKFKVGEIGDYEGKVYDDKLGAVYMIVTERFGQSIATKYMGLDADDPRLGPGTYTEAFDDKCYDQFFPKQIPENIRSQVKPLLHKLKEAGWQHEDIHAGNFVVKDEIVKIIDFVLVEFNSFLRRLF